MKITITNEKLRKSTIFDLINDETILSKITDISEKDFYLENATQSARAFGLSKLGTIIKDEDFVKQVDRVFKDVFDSVFTE